MKETVDFNQFIDRAQEFDCYKQLCGYKGCRLLFDYLSELEEDLGEEIELDIIGFCCDFDVMTLNEYAEEYQAAALEAAKEELQEEALACLEFLKACGHKGIGWDRAVIHATAGSESKRIKPKPKG